MTTERTVHLVRHGESTWNRLGRVQGQSPLAGGLTARGWVQASSVAAALERRLRDALAGGPAAVVSSDLVRARQTAAVIGSRLGSSVVFDPSLREQQLGALEGRALDSLLAGVAVREVVAGLWHDRALVPPGGGESVAQLAERARRAVLGLTARAGQRQLVLVAHGGLIRSLLSPGPGLPAPLANATAVSVLVRDDGSIEELPAPAGAGVQP
jgi:probable phosphoglycerate mutase